MGDDNQEQINFNGETLIVTLQLIKIRTIKWAFKNLKVILIIVGGRHRSATTKTYGDLTSKGSEILYGYCSICNGRKSMIFCVNTIQAEGLGNFFKKLGIISAKTGKNLATNALKNPGRILEIGVNIATAAASRNPKAALSTLPEVINFYHTGEVFYLGKFVKFFLRKMTKKQKDYTQAHH